MGTSAQPVSACPGCGAAQRAQARFCDACGMRLPQRPEALTAALRAAHGRDELADGEAKQVTVMFVDIVGSMGLSERLGPDAWRTLLERFFLLASEAVHAVEGTVDKFTGDGIMAIFGAPIGQEDHARRACLAALRLHASLRPFAAELEGRGLQLRVRVGLNSGEVVVGGIGDDLHMSYTAIGHTVGVAARMESIAPPGSTALSARTAALVGGEFTLDVLHEALPVKGTNGPQRIFELRGRGTARTRVDIKGLRGELSPFVGREEERTVLDAALDRALAGSGSVVALSGEPGMGKSRLVTELGHRCAARGVATVQARAEAHGRGTPLLPVLELLRSAFGISDEDEPRAARARTAVALAALSPAFEPELALLWDFLGIPDPERPAAQIDPEARERRMVELVTRIVRARGRHEPLLLVLEDLHWLDDASAIFLEELVRAVADVRVLVVLTYRPEYVPRPDAARHVTELRLAPLPRTAVDALLAETLGTHPSVRALAGRVADRADGNPFFCEELVQVLVDQDRLGGPRGARTLAGDAADIDLPPTVQATLAARIDGLEPAAKALLLVASVVGEATDWRLLDLVGDIDGGELVDALRELVASDLLIERLGDERIEYAFRHPLIQEVAYRSQIQRRRRQTHGRVADGIATLHADRLDERAGLLAHHCEQADRIVEAAQWHARAATWVGVTTPAEAMRHWQAARRLAATLPDGPDRTGLSLGAHLGILSQAWRLSISHDVADGSHRDAVALLTPAEQEGPMRVLIDYAYSANLGFGGRMRDGLAVARVNTPRAEAIGDAGLVILAAGAQWYGALSCGHVREGYEVAARALERAAGDTRTGEAFSGALDHPYALCLLGRGYCAGFMGRVRAAQDDIHRAIQLARDEGNGEVEPLALSSLTFLHAMVGEGEVALRDARRALHVAERRGNGMAIMAGWVALVWAGLATGDDALADDAAREMIDLGAARTIGVELLTFAHGGRSEVARRQGRTEDAVAHAEAAMRTARWPQPTWGELMARVRMSNALVARDGRGGVPEALAHLGRAGALARRHGIVVCDPELHRAHALLARAEGDAAEALRHDDAAAQALRALVAA